MRLIDADATIKYLREFRCKDCDRRKGMKNGKIRFCYEIGDAPCRACDIWDTVDYFLDEDISPTVDAVQIVRCRDCKWWDRKDDNSHYGYCHACKHGYHSEHWQIGIYRVYKEDFFCADGEKEEQDGEDT